MAEPDDSEARRFEAALRRVLSVSKEELLKREAAEKRQRQRRRAKKVRTRRAS